MEFLRFVIIFKLGGIPPVCCVQVGVEFPQFVMFKFGWNSPSLSCSSLGGILPVCHVQVGVDGILPVCHVQVGVEFLQFVTSVVTLDLFLCGF